MSSSCRVKRAQHTFDLEGQQTSGRHSQYGQGAHRRQDCADLFGTKALDAGFHDGTVQATSIPRQSSAMRFRRLSQNDEVVNTRSRQSAISPSKGRNAYLRHLDDRQELHQSRRDLNHGFRQNLTQNHAFAGQQRTAAGNASNLPKETAADLQKPPLNRQKQPQRNFSLDLGDLTNLERESDLSIFELEWNFDRRQRHASSYGIASNPSRKRQHPSTDLPPLRMPPRREIVSSRHLTPTSSTLPAYSSDSSRASILPRLPSPPPLTRNSRRSLPQRLTPNFLQVRRKSEKPRPRTLPALLRKSVFRRTILPKSHSKEEGPSHHHSKDWRIPTMDFDHDERLVGTDDRDLVDSWYFRDLQETDDDYKPGPLDYETPISGVSQASMNDATIDPTTDNQATVEHSETNDVLLGSVRPSNSVVLAHSQGLSSSSNEQPYRFQEAHNIPTQDYHLNAAQQESHHRHPSHHSLQSHLRQTHPASSTSFHKLAQRPPSFPPPSLPKRLYQSPERLPLYHDSLHPTARNFSTASAATTTGGTATSTLSTSSLLSSYYARSLSDFTRGGLARTGQTAHLTASTTVPTTSPPTRDSDYSLEKGLNADGGGFDRARKEDVGVYELDEATWFGGRLEAGSGERSSVATIETKSLTDGEKMGGKSASEDLALDTATYGLRSGGTDDTPREREYRGDSEARRRGVVWV
ncbi:MAG: hypothetical protein M1831_002157 [Alyxoria varia]|nr:MAG: hypothetical protein M1831_002157 [Alyxoria varia]